MSEPDSDYIWDSDLGISHPACAKTAFGLLPHIDDRLVAQAACRALQGLLMTHPAQPELMRIARHYELEFPPTDEGAQRYAAHRDLLLRTAGWGGYGEET